MQSDNSLLKCGETTTSNQVERLGLSPLPITTGRKPIAVSQFITTTESGLLKIRLVNADVHLTQMFLVQFSIMSSMIVLFWLNVGETWLAALPIFGFGTLCFFTMYYTLFKDNNQALSNRPPILLHPQKQQILLAKPLSDGPMPTPPPVIGNNKLTILTIVAFFGIGMGSMSLFSYFQSGDSEYFFFIIFPLALGSPCALLALKPWLSYFKARRHHNGKQVIFGVPWESLSIEYQRHDGMNQWGTVSLQNITFTAPAEYGNNVGFSLPVYSKEEALSLFELIRDHMENGAEGIEHTAANNIKTSSASYSRAGYRRLILKRMRKTPLIYPFWRLLNIVTLRYVSHWYLEYQIDTLQQKALDRDDVKAWLAPLPKEQWVAQSAELTRANTQARALYKTGVRWEDEAMQRLIKQYT